ncbi:hypothetical protein [Halorubrum sp. AJ67]|uniref:hypothetical protein n=1 Tax=Halorubrum sp. AJ67 TaxID=1173487 RepID=UPI0003DC3B58|nr:hypothetical protein [Halorubrum sp. AJ67]CDK39397.1 putative membrane protein [Halorubrum sp. AJ67]
MASSPSDAPGDLTGSVGSQLARDPLGVAGLLVVFGAVLATGTGRDAVLAGVLLCVALLLPASLAFVVGQLALSVAVTVEDRIAVGVAQLALLVVLTQPARDRSLPNAVVGTLAAYAVLLGVVAVGLRESHFAAAGLLCLAVALGTYLARRLTLVRLGLVGAEPKE